MEILEENIKIENKKLAHANFIYLENFNEGVALPKNENEYGFIISRIKKGDKNYIINIQCNEKLSLESTRNIIEKKNHVDLYEIQEYFLNGMSRYLKFNTEAYFRIINEENPEEIKMIFTDYLECLEYLESVEK
jgi:hypothetical protein